MFGWVRQFSVGRATSDNAVYRRCIRHRKNVDFGAATRDGEMSIAYDLPDLLASRR